MSRKPEQKLWDQLSKHTKDLVDWTRVEPGHAGEGFPDLDGIEIAETQGAEFKLELKVSKTKSYVVTGLWKPTQIAWQTRRARFGGRVWNLVHHPHSETLKLYHCSKLLPLILEGTGAVTPCLTTKDDGPGFREIVRWMITESR